MAFSFSGPLTNYNALRYPLIAALEGVELKPYADSVGLATIGVGFLVWAQAQAILEQMGYAQDPKFSAYVLAIRNAVRSGGQDIDFGQPGSGQGATPNDRVQNALTNALRKATKNNTVVFEFTTSTQVEQVFNTIVQNFETQVDTWAANANPPIAQPPLSRERLVLLSLSYSPVLSQSTKLRDALQPTTGSRAEAWYQIRYESNGGKSRSIGIAKRRFLEAAVFGLYQNQASVSAGEAKEVYRFLQAHRTEVLAYEAMWGLHPDERQTRQRNAQGQTALNLAAQETSLLQTLGQEIGQAIGLSPGFSPPPAWPTLEWTFDPAKTALLLDLRSQYSSIADWLTDGTFVSTNFYMAPDVNSRLVVDTRPYERNRFASGARDVLWGGNKNDLLIGRKGDDVLIGDAGNDTLEGGPGADILIGGSGRDTYVWNPEEDPAEDRVIDEDGEGVFVLKDAAGNINLLSGTYVQVNATTWRNLKTGADVITHNSPWTLTLPDGSTVNLGEDFEWGDFDLDLLATPTAPQPTLTILGDLTPVEPLQYDELGNLVVDPNTPAPDRDDALNGRDSDTEGDLIQGLGGDDILTGKAGDDQLEGGAGEDWVSGDPGKDLLLGGADRDVLWGGPGDDRLYADAEIALETAIAQGETDPPTGTQGEFLDGVVGDDILVSGAADDVLLGGGGADLLVGGAGDDSLLGDLTSTSLTPGWTVLRQVEQNPNGQTVYVWSLDGGSAEPDLDPGDDTIYGGAGADWIFGGPGADLLDGGNGDDVLFGEDGDDALVGGADSDVLVGGGAWCLRGRGPGRVPAGARCPHENRRPHGLRPSSPAGYRLLSKVIRESVVPAWGPGAIGLQLHGVSGKHGSGMPRALYDGRIVAG